MPVINLIHPGSGGAVSAPAALADINVAVISGTLNTSTGTQDFTFAGFGTPKAAIVFGLDNPNDLQTTMGATDGTNQWCISTAAESAATSDTYRLHRTDEIILAHNLAGATSIEANFDSFITDGIRINITKAASGHRMVFVLFNGDDVSADCGTVALATALGSTTVSPGFETNALLIGSVNGGSGSITTNAVHMTGLASYDGATIRQCCMNYTSIDAAGAGDPRAALMSSKIWVQSDAGDNVTLENITSTSFDLTSNNSDLSSIDVGYLALSLNNGNAWAGVLDAPTATGNHTFTDPGFLPSLAIILPTMFSATNVARTNAEAGAFGLAVIDGNDNWCGVWTDEDAAGPTVCSGFVTNQAIDLNADDGTAAFDATFVEFTSNGMTFNFSAADVTTRKWLALFISKGG